MLGAVLRGAAHSNRDAMSRNPFCKHYLNCLNSAAKAGRPLDCEPCPHFNEDTGDRGTEAELYNLYLLWTAVFRGRDAAERLRQGEDENLTN